MTWVTFLPCFLWVFVGAPYVERLRGSPRLAGALAGITASVVGVVGMVALWFGGKVLLPAGAGWTGSRWPSPWSPSPSCNGRKCPARGSWSRARESDWRAGSRSEAERRLRADSPSLASPAYPLGPMTKLTRTLLAISLTASCGGGGGDSRQR